MSDCAGVVRVFGDWITYLEYSNKKRINMFYYRYSRHRLREFGYLKIPVETTFYAKGSLLIQGLIIVPNISITDRLVSIDLA